MGTLLTILLVLFIALVVVVPLVERFGKPHSNQEISKIARWVLPLMMLLLVLQALRHFFF